MQFIAIKFKVAAIQNRKMHVSDTTFTMRRVRVKFDIGASNKYLVTSTFLDLRSRSLAELI